MFYVEDFISVSWMTYKLMNIIRLKFQIYLLWLWKTYMKVWCH